MLNEKDICQEVNVPESVIEYSKSIDFVSNNNPVIGFFIVEPAMLFFD